MDSKSLCTIAYQADAHDAAQHVLVNMIGWTVRVVPYGSTEGGDGELIEAGFDDHTGELMVTIALWDDDAGRGDPNRTLTFNVWEDLDRIEVL